MAVVNEDNHLEGVIVRGSLIAGLTTTTEHADEEFTDFSGVGRESAQRGTAVGQETDGRR